MIEFLLGALLFSSHSTTVIEREPPRPLTKAERKQRAKDAAVREKEWQAHLQKCKSCILHPSTPADIMKTIF